MKQHITRAYNTFEIDKNKGILTKSSKETRLKDEINYYTSIQQYSPSIFFPRYIGANDNNGINNLLLDYLAYDNLGNLMIEDYNESLWADIINNLKYILKEFSLNLPYFDLSPYLRSMYIGKTEKYYNELVENFDLFKKIKKQEYIWINDVYYKNFDNIWPDIKNIIEKKLLEANFCIIHGDFCFSNILYGTNPKSNITILRLVDPRGSFGEVGIYGDPRYDIAKLRHSYEGGYEYIIYDRFLLRQDSDDYFKYYFLNDNRKRIKTLFDEFPEFNTVETKLIEGLIFIGMCSRHYDSLKRQIIMYCTGIKLLNEVLEEI
jgi:hypothetical protein